MQRTILLLLSIIFIVCATQEIYPQTDDINLLELPAELKKLSLIKDDSKILKNLPVWLTERNQIAKKISKKQRKQLETMLPMENPPELRALAAIWLLSEKRMQDIKKIETLIGDKRKALILPYIISGQLVQLYYPVIWKSITVEEVAIECLGILIGKHFKSVDSFKKWRRKNPDLLFSFEFWVERLNNTTLRSSQLKEELSILEKNSELYIRVMTMQDRNNHHTPDWRIIAMIDNHVSHQELISLLKREREFPEFEDINKFYNFANWIYKRADHFFSANPEELIELWQQNITLTSLALAAARLNPYEGTKILKKSISKIEFFSTKEALVYELAHKHLASEFSTIETLFHSEQSDRSKIMILKAIGDIGENARPWLRCLLLNGDFPKKFDEECIVKALVSTIKKLDPTMEFEKEKYLCRIVKTFIVDADKINETVQDSLNQVQKWLENDDQVLIK